MSRSTYAVIPTKFVNYPVLRDLIENLQNDHSVDKIIVVDNGGFPREYLPTLFPKTTFIEAAGKTIYEMWNKAWDYCKSIGEDEYNIAFLNDDIILPPNAIMALSWNLRTSLAPSNLGIIYPDVDGSWNLHEGQRNGTANTYFDIHLTNTTHGAGGMTGFCFVVKGEINIRVDENLKLYWGDDDLVKQMTAAGYTVGCLVNLPIKHIGSVTINQLDRVKRDILMEEDRRYFNQKYHENRSPVI